MEGRIYSPIGDQYSSDIKVDGFGNYFQLVKDELIADIQRTLNTQMYEQHTQYGSQITFFDSIDMSAVPRLPEVSWVPKIDLTDKYPVGTIVEYNIDGGLYEVISREDWEIAMDEPLEPEFLPVCRLDAPDYWEEADMYDGFLENHINRVVEDYLSNWQVVDAHDHSYGHGVYIVQNPPQADSINIEFTVELPKPGPRKPQPRYGWHG